MGSLPASTVDNEFYSYNVMVHSTDWSCSDMGIRQMNIGCSDMGIRHVNIGCSLYAAQ